MTAPTAGSTPRPSPADKQRILANTESHADALEYAYAEGYRHGREQAEAALAEALRLLGESREALRTYYNIAAKMPWDADRTLELTHAQTAAAKLFPLLRAFLAAVAVPQEGDGSAHPAPQGERQTYDNVKDGPELMEPQP